MLQVERHRKINQILHSNGVLLVNDLSCLLNASRETIRRDLAFLERKGFLRRTHGGAIEVEEQVKNITVPVDLEYENSGEAFRTRANQNTDVKIKMAKKALGFIEPGDIILLDSSTSTNFLARQIPDIEITALTTSLNTIHALACKSNIRVVGLGGEYSEKYESFSGPLTESVIKEFHINKTFFSCHGIGLTTGIRESNENQARLKQIMISVADKSILLCDSTKIERSSFCKVSDYHEIDVLITDHLPSDEYRMEIGWNNVKIIETEKIK
jgi:DeoR family transcriptional regulator, L-fucose operon activator